MPTLAKLMRDYNAIKKGKVGKRVGLRVVGKPPVGGGFSSLAPGKKRAPSVVSENAPLFVPHEQTWILLENEPLIPICRNLCTLGPHGRSRIRGCEQCPRLAGNICSHKP